LRFLKIWFYTLQKDTMPYLLLKTLGQSTW
jgi:hypothetical protein